MFSDLKKIPRLMWGPSPIISNKYWSQAMQKLGYKSHTVVFNYYSAINKKNDYDIYIYELIQFPLATLRKIFSLLFAPYWGFCFSLLNFDIFHFPFHGGILGSTSLWMFEAFLLKLAKKKTVLMAYGGDAYMYSKIIDKSWQHGLLYNYPIGAKKEYEISQKVTYWSKHADIVMGLFSSVDGMSRWDLLPVNHVVIDINLWSPKTFYSMNDGINGYVKIIHTPNHRSIKETEFLIDSVNALIELEGLKIELLLIEKTQNDKIRELMQTGCDILAEQFLMGYALSAIEGMSCGLPVLSKILQDEGVEFDFQLVENLSYIEAKKLYQKADLLIDQLLIGWYGGLAVELMALGKPVICFIQPNDLQFVPIPMKADMPLIQATPTTIYEVLKEYLTYRQHNLKALGQLSRAYVETWHDSLKIAAFLKANYMEAFLKRNLRPIALLR